MDKIKYNVEIKLVDGTIIKDIIMNQKQYKKLSMVLNNRFFNCLKLEYIGLKEETMYVFKSNILYIKLKERNGDK